jgi:hypothetical protein
VDFIKRYIFPGSCIPSITAISNAVAKATDLRLVQLEGITPHYARTLREWRRRFLPTLQRLNQNIADGELFHGVAINYRKDGSEFMMEWKIAPIRNQKDEISHYLAIQRYVTRTHT